MCGGFSPVSRNSQRFPLIHVVTYQHLFLRVWERKQCWAFTRWLLRGAIIFCDYRAKKIKRKSGKLGRASGLISRMDGSLFYRSISFNFSGHFLVCPPRLLNTKWNDPSSFRVALYIHEICQMTDGQLNRCCREYVTFGHRLLALAAENSTCC